MYIQKGQQRKIVVLWNSNVKPGKYNQEEKKLKDKMHK